MPATCTLEDGKTLLYQTLSSETKMEVDKDENGYSQIVDCGKSMLDAFNSRLEEEANNFRKITANFIDELHPQENEKFGGFTMSTFADSAKKSVKTIDDRVKLIRSLIAELNSRAEAKLACKASRRLRCELVALYVLQAIAQHKDLLVDSLNSIFKLIPILKSSSSRKEYVSNIEMRLAYLEGLYIHIFDESYEFDLSLRDAGTMESRLAGIHTDLSSARTELEEIAGSSEQIHQLMDGLRDLDSKVWSLSNAICNSSRSRREHDVALGKLESVLSKLNLH